MCRWNSYYFIGSGLFGIWLLFIFGIWLLFLAYDYFLFLAYDYFFWHMTTFLAYDYFFGIWLLFLAYDYFFWHMTTFFWHMTTFLAYDYFFGMTTFLAYDYFFGIWLLFWRMTAFYLDVIPRSFKESWFLHLSHQRISGLSLKMKSLRSFEPPVTSRPASQPEELRRQQHRWQRRKPCPNVFPKRPQCVRPRNAQGMFSVMWDTNFKV